MSCASMEAAASGWSDRPVEAAHGYGVPLKDRLFETIRQWLMATLYSFG